MKASIKLFSLFIYLITVPGFAQETITPATALQAYLHNGDTHYQWSVRDSFQLETVKGYNLILTSQKWREYTWRHQLTILVPRQNNHDGALLFITGGSNRDEQPNWKKNDDELVASLAHMASTNKAITAVIRQTPNQPLYGDRTEDELISYTLHNYKQDGDFSWPLLFPMVKSAVRGMDAIQEFSQKNLRHKISKFVVSGASKRGWTTWLTGAHDTRVAAIGPMVIDVLNMPVSLNYQLEVWKDYSVQIQDYVDLGIPQGAETESGKALNTMIDPYSYRKALTMPKMIFIGTNDEYWPVDAIKNYLDSIPGKNLIHYVPNAGHDLGGGKQALTGLSAFFGTTLLQRNYPECQWECRRAGNAIKLDVAASKDLLLDAVVWSAVSEDRDFRNETFSRKSLNLKNKSKISINEPLPTTGFKAFYLDLNYQAPNGEPYTVSTRMFVADAEGIL